MARSLPFSEGFLPGLFPSIPLRVLGCGASSRVEGSGILEDGLGGPDLVVEDEVG